MGWQDLLQSEDERIIVPWLDGRELNIFGRTWAIKGKLPAEIGWHEFKIQARKALWVNSANPECSVLKNKVTGYLVGDKFVPDQVRVSIDPVKLAKEFKTVHLLEMGLDRFARITAGRFCDDGPLVFEELAFPLGPEDQVLQAYLDQKESVDDIVGVVPALDAAFRFEIWQRKETERRRREAEERRLAEERKRAEEERKTQLIQRLGDGSGRREMAVIDFGEAARAALAVGGAEYLDHRQAYRRNEKIVRFRYMRRRFECVCDNQLRIIDAGICLTDHETGEKGDTRFTLESFPSVIKEAIDTGQLVIFRHAE